METIFKTLETSCKVGCTLGLRAKLARSEIRNKRQRNDATKAGFGEAPQQAILRILPEGKILKMGMCVHTCPACRLAETTK
jgi:hypothetical protein